MVVSRAVVFVEKPLSPTIVEFSATLTCNWASNLNPRVTILENKEVAQHSASAGASSPQPSTAEGEGEPLLGQPAAASSKPSTPIFRRLTDSVFGIVKDANQHLEGNLMVFLLLLRWYGLYALLIASCLAGGLIAGPTWPLLLLSGLMAGHLMLLITSIVKQETVTVIGHIGIQIRIQYLFGERTRFIDKDKLEGAFVHEFVRGSAVRTALALLLQGEPGLCLVFDQCYPGFQALRRVYQVCLAECKQ